MRRALHFAITLLVPVALTAQVVQPQARFAAGTIPGTLRYQVVIEGAGRGEISGVLGQLDNLEVLAGPVLTQQITWRGDRAVAVTALTWVVRARKLGPIAVGPTTVRFGDEKAVTNPVHGTALAGGHTAGETPRPELRVDLSRSRLLVGEPLVVRFFVESPGESLTGGWEVQASFPESWSERLPLEDVAPSAADPEAVPLGGWLVIPGAGRAPGDSSGGRPRRGRSRRGGEHRTPRKSGDLTRGGGGCHAAPPGPGAVLRRGRRARVLTPAARERNARRRSGDSRGGGGGCREPPAPRSPAPTAARRTACVPGGGDPRVEAIPHGPGRAGGGGASRSRCCSPGGTSCPLFASAASDPKRTTQLTSCPHWRSWCARPPLRPRWPRHPPGISSPTARSPVLSSSSWRLSWASRAPRLRSPGECAAGSPRPRPSRPRALHRNSGICNLRWRIGRGPASGWRSARAPTAWRPRVARRPRRRRR